VERNFSLGKQFYSMDALRTIIREMVG